MKMTVFDRRANTIAGQKDRLANIIESETRFGVGASFKRRHEHDVMDELEKAGRPIGLADCLIAASAFRRLPILHLSFVIRLRYRRLAIRSITLPPAGQNSARGTF
jgi:hypothetical protein